jgi:hypothetical protein
VGTWFLIAKPNAAAEARDAFEHSDQLAALLGELGVGRRP